MRKINGNNYLTYENNRYNLINKRTIFKMIAEIVPI